MNLLRELFDDNKAEKLSDKAFKALEKERGCPTCKNKRKKAVCPGIKTAEEFECIKGRERGGAVLFKGNECDTVLFKIKHCPEWERLR